MTAKWQYKQAYEAALEHNHELAAENAKLREEFNKMDVWHSKELTAAMDENAKLRELVRELWAQAEQNLVCDDNCPYGAACDWKDCVFERLMRELGVEVDDGN